MPKLTGHLSLTPAEIDGALAAAKGHMPALAPLKSLLLKGVTGGVEFVYEAPLLGDVQIDSTLSVDESG